MNKMYISMLIILFQIYTPLKSATDTNSLSDVVQKMVSLQKELGSLQTEAQKKDPSLEKLLEEIQGLQNELHNLQFQTHDIINPKDKPSKLIKKSTTRLDSLNKVSDEEVKKAHDGPTIHNKNSPINTNSIKPQSMENDNDDFNTENQSNQETTPLHVVDQETEKDANIDPDTKSHQSFFLGEGVVNVQALSLKEVDAFDAKNKKDKKIGSYKRSLNYVQGYSLGILTIGKKTIQVLEDNAATRTPIVAVMQNGISKKAIAYIKNPEYNKMLKKSPAIINLYEYKP